MIEKHSIDAFISRKNDHPLIDVRSPGEFDTGHIPGSINIPLLNDEERIKVGTSYKQKGRIPAIELGFDLVGPRLGDMIREIKEKVPGDEAILYCWRGGMRSNNMAWLLNTIGIDCQVLEGGYKAYRNYGKNKFSEYPTVYIIGGFTGSNKTKVLDALTDMDEQVLDIEAIARHRGSSFGAIGQEAQLANEQFENQLIHQWLSFDPEKAIWIEDESKILGSNHLPEPLYQRIRNSPVYKLEISKKQRAQNLVEDYGQLSKDDLEKAIRRIERRLGGQNMQEAVVALETGDLVKVAEIALSYYDKTYAFGLSKRDASTITIVEPRSNSPYEKAKQLLELVQK